jgi:hypothetical protein
MHSTAGNGTCFRAFWSIDAAFALVLSVAMFAMFSSMLYSEGLSALGSADETSGVLLSARFSSYALELMERGEWVDLASVLEQTNKKYASLRAEDEFTQVGNESGAIYCTQRLYVNGSRMVKLEACIG